MSLGIALTTVISSLSANQQAMSLISNNIANANSTNYTRREVVQSSQVVNGVASGVQIEEVRRAIDEFVVSSARRQVSHVGRYEVQAKYYDRLELFLGQPGSSSNINAQFDSFFARLGELAGSPDQASLRTNTLESAVSLTTSVSTLARNLQQLRFDIDQEIKQQVTDINNLLGELQSINISLKNTGSIGGDKTALLDARDLALSKLSKIIDVEVTFNGDGQATVLLPRTDLLNASSRFQLDYIPAVSVDSLIGGAPFSAITARLLDTEGNPSGATVTLSSATNAPTQEQYFTSGSLKGLLDMRDNELPNMLEQLDVLAQTFADAFNAVHNDGIGFPPPTMLTGTRLVSPVSDYVFTGSMSLALLNSDGSPIAGHFGEGMPPLNLDFSTLTSTGSPGQVDLNAIVREINEYYGSPPAQIASLGPLSDIRLAAVSDSMASTHASGTIIFTDNPAAGDTITIGSQTFEFVAGTPTSADEIQRGTSLFATVQNIVKRLNTSNLGNVNTAEYAINGVNGITVTHKTAGSDPNGVFALAADLASTTASINGGLADDEPSDFLAGGVDAGGTFTFDFEMSNLTGGDATFEILDLSINGGLPTGQTLGAFTSTAGLRQRTNLGGAANGENISIAIPAGLQEGDSFTISVDIRVTDSDGNITTDTVTFTVTVPDPNENIINKRYAATAANDGDTLAAPVNNSSYATARIVDANGNPVASGQPGYLQITSNRTGVGIAIDEGNSLEGGLISNPSGTATGRGMSHFFGLNDFFTTGTALDGAAANFTVRDGYRTNPSRLATAELVLSNQPTDPTADPIYTYETGIGSNQLVTRLGALKTARQTFSAAGGLPSAVLTFGNYSSEILSFAALSNQRIDAALEQEQVLYDAFQERLDATGGINVDEELANTVLFQNNFNASARLITIISEMFDKMVESF